MAVGVEGGGRAAFLSTPSLFFALPPAERARARHAVLDFDTQWAGDAGFAFFDYRAYAEEGGAAPAAAGRVPAALEGAFDLVVIDPPFITAEVWAAYARAAAALLRPAGPRRVLATTVAENAGLLARLFPGARATAWKPSIPHLVYQYDAFANFECAPLAVENPNV